MGNVVLDFLWKTGKLCLIPENFWKTLFDSRKSESCLCKLVSKIVVKIDSVEIDR